MTRNATNLGSFPLLTRQSLPDALRVLLADYSRETWLDHSNFHGLISFWLDRHLMFRRLLDAMTNEAETMLDGKTELLTYQHRLHRYASTFVQQLHGHHHIEDEHYFPKLTKLDKRLSHGFNLLDADHHALDGLLERFTEKTNGVLQVGQDSENGKPVLDTVGALHEEIVTFEKFLNRHLVDEEELIVPIILKHGPDNIG